MQKAKNRGDPTTGGSLVPLVHFELYLDGEPQGCFMNGLDDVFPATRAEYWDEEFKDLIDPPDVSVRRLRENAVRFWFTPDGLKLCRDALRGLCSDILFTGLWTVSISVLRIPEPELAVVSIWRDRHQAAIPEDAAAAYEMEGPYEMTDLKAFDEKVTQHIRMAGPSKRALQEKAGAGAPAHE